MAKKTEEWTGEDFYREAARIIDGDADDHLCGAMMLSMLRDGCSFKELRRVAHEQGVPVSKLRPWWRRLRSNGVFRSGGEIRADWCGENGGLALIMDVCVAKGLMQRAHFKEKAHAP